MCYGTLLVTAGHLSYSDDVPDAVEYLAERIEAEGFGARSASTAEIVQIAEEEGGDFAGLIPGTTLDGEE